MLLSGGLDSATAAAVAKSDGYDLFALSFSYGQRHSGEVECAKRVGRSLEVADHVTIEFDLTKWGGSALTGDEDVPLDRDEEEMSGDIPPTYVPARNTIFLSFALAYAEVVGADTIVIGVNQVDYSGYPDCRGEYLAAFENMANLATSSAVKDGKMVRIYAPLLHLTKAEIIKLGVGLGVDYALTWSCYQGLDKSCGRCDSCILRAKGFSEAGLKDPLIK